MKGSVERRGDAGPPREGSAPAAPALETIPYEYLPPALWQEPFKLSKLLKSTFLEGRKVLILRFACNFLRSG